MFILLLEKKLALVSVVSRVDLSLFSVSTWKCNDSNECNTYWTATEELLSLPQSLFISCLPHFYSFLRQLVAAVVVVVAVAVVVVLVVAWGIVARYKIVIQVHKPKLVKIQPEKATLHFKPVMNAK